MLPVIGIPCFFHESNGGHIRDASFAQQSYIRAIESTGAAPLLIPITVQEHTLKALFERIDGLLLTGGHDIDPSRYNEGSHPFLTQIDKQRDWVEFTITPWAISKDIPVLGICRGIQTLNVCAGGSLWLDLSTQVPNSIKHNYFPDYPRNQLSHLVQLETGSLLSGIFRQHELEVNSLHHQGIKDIGKKFRVSARAPDGIIEGIEMIDKTWIVGVQWHPEELINDNRNMKNLFKAFISACGNHTGKIININENSYNGKNNNYKTYLG